VVVVLVGWWLRPDIFYDRFIWEDIWGPLLADASQTSRLEHNGVVAIGSLDEKRIEPIELTRRGRDLNRRFKSSLDFQEMPRRLKR
jgi:hypothetical protein